jgi:serine/threonine protein kinase
MEYVEGKTIADDLANGQVFGENEAIDIIIQVCHALEHAHAHGLVHRDVKPKNIMINTQGVVKLADMGLARETTDIEAAQSEEGKAYGTPYYISPEQIRGKIDIDALSRDRDQLWAEAMFRYQEGSTWWLDVPEVIAQAELEQMERYRGDPWDAKIHAFLRYEDEVGIDQILGTVLEIPVGRWTQADYNRVAASLRVAGWRKARARVAGERSYVYRPHTLAAKRESGKTRMGRI